MRDETSEKIISLLVTLSILTFNECGVSAEKMVTKNAVYLGVKGYGLAETNKDTKDEFLYRFEVDGEENIYKLSNGTKDKDGNYDYPIRNKLKKGSRYIVAIEDGFITTVEEIKKRGITSISLEATDMGRPLYQRFGFVNMEYEMELPE